MYTVNNAETLSLSVLMAIFQMNLGYPIPERLHSDFTGAKVLTTDIQSSSQIFPINKPTPSIFTGRMPLIPFAQPTVSEH